MASTARYPVTKFRNNIFKILREVHYGKPIIIFSKGIEYEVTRTKTREEQILEKMEYTAQQNKKLHTFDGITQEMKTASIKEGRL